MHRIDTPTAQKDKFGAGKNGFTRGNPQTGTPATDLDDDYFDMLQEELAGVVEATGVNLEKSKHDQLLTALKALLLSRAHPFADIKADGAAAIAEALSNLGLTAITTVAGATDSFPYFSGPNSARLTPLTDFARNLLSKPDNIDARTALGLGNAATRNIGTANGTVAAGDDDRFNLMLAVNQTYQDVRASRVVNTSYTNSTGKPIFIVVSAVQDSQGSPIVLTATIDNQAITTYSYGSNAVGTLTLPVPNGSTYKINVSNGTNPRVINWLELRS